VVTIFGQLKEEMFAYAARSSFISPEKAPNTCCSFYCHLALCKAAKKLAPQMRVIKEHETFLFYFRLLFLMVSTGK
jgi:hypothetical protein